MRLAFFLVTMCSLIFINGCVQVTKQRYSQNTQLAVTSVWDVPTHYRQQSRFAVVPRVLKEVSLTSNQQQVVYQRFQQAIIDDFELHGFQQTSAQPDFYIGFAVALSGDLSDTTIGEKFGVTPGLQAQAEQEKGSFLIYVEDANSGQRIWRGAVQGFVQEKMTNQQRKERAEKIVAMVLTQFYKFG